MKKEITLKYSIILSLSLIAYFLLTNLFNISGINLVGWLGYLPYILIIYIGLILNKHFFHNYKSRFLFGFLISIIGALVSSIFMFVYLTYVDDLMIQTAVENQIKTLDRTLSNYNQTATRIKTLITPSFYLIFGTITGIVIGSIISAITALVIKKKMVE